ncbi:aldo/keto reductase [Pseudomonas sp. Leaf48]|uniref:aldo/keto reductase n=1 Tax=Pseudomonas sp. Leaf48 TaxID=1736221 RepID=UPI0022A9D9EA|nr:aldo/keto reductase [Pseudomonas sp. Leaf48]
MTLGTMMFGKQTSTEDSLRSIDKAWNLGTNFIDTADVYSDGRSEEIVGEAIASRRQEWALATKVDFGPADGLPNRSDLSRKHIFNGIEASLTRLGTDYLDICTAKTTTSLHIARQIQQYTQERGVGIVEFAIAWVLNNSALTSAIVGPRTEEPWDAYTKAQAVRVSAEDGAFIDSLVTPGHASTPGFNDVSHFVSGRRSRTA